MAELGLHQWPFFEATKLKILVIPVGTFPSDAFASYLGHLRTLSRISHAELALNFQQDPFFKSHLTHLTASSNEKSCLSFEFVEHAEKETFPAWLEFQTHRKLFGIIGLIHCPSSPSRSLSVAYKRFNQLCTMVAIPSLLLGMCMLIILCCSC